MSSLPQVTRLKDENMRAFAYRVLFACIREIILPPGYAMSEAKMAKELMISRTPVHDTFARLYREGLLEIAPQSGTFVRCLDPESIKELRWINLTMDALRSRNIPAGFAFLDGEESGHKGAELFRKRKENPAFSSVVSLDLCGYGDTIAVYCRGSRKQPGAAAFCDSERLKTHHGQLVKFLPEGDDIIFSARVQPVLSIAVLPKWDIPYTNALDSYREHLIAKPPEFYTMTGEMEIMGYHLQITCYSDFKVKKKSLSFSDTLQLYHRLSPVSNAFRQEMPG